MHRVQKEKKISNYNDEIVSDYEQQYKNEITDNISNKFSVNSRPHSYNNRSGSMHWSNCSSSVIKDDKAKKECSRKFTSQSEIKNGNEFLAENNTDPLFSVKEFAPNYMNSTVETKQDKKTKQKKKLFKLVEVLKKQLNQKDKDIYRIEQSHLMNSLGITKTSQDSCDVYLKNGDNNEQIDPLSTDESLLEKTKHMLLAQHEDINALKEELKKKDIELKLLKNDNKMQNDILLEAKRDLEKNYYLLTHYKNKVKEYERKLDAKLHKNKKLFNSEENTSDEHHLRISEKNFNIKMQEKIILALNEEIKKRDKTICELKNIIENVGLNNNRDIIKYKQSNIDLLNKLNLNTSLVKSQKIEIENLHLNFKQVEEDLKNKDEEIKKLHETILDKEEENNKLKTDVNKLIFDLKIKNVNLVNIKKKIKTIKKENCLNLKKQEEHFVTTLNEKCKERDTTITNQTNELEKLLADYEKVKSVNAKLKTNFEDMKKKVLKKEKIITKIQDQLLEQQAKVLVYENNNEVQTLKKNEEHLRKKLEEQMYRNEQLLNNSFLLKKCTVEKHALEKEILNLKGALYAREEEIKKLKGAQNKKRTNTTLSEDTCSMRAMMYKNGIPLKPTLNLSNGEASDVPATFLENTKFMPCGSKNVTPSKEDPVDLALCDYLNCFSNSRIKHKPLQVHKIDTNTYNVNGEKVVIRFLNGELYVEHNSHPIKLQDYLLKHVNTY